MEYFCLVRATLLGLFFTATVAKYSTTTTTTDVLAAASSVNHRFKTQRYSKGFEQPF